MDAALKTEDIRGQVRVGPFAVEGEERESFHDLRATGVCRSVNGVELLSESDLFVPSGRRVAVLGPSGCGKTTLLRVIAGLAPVSSGEVWLGDRLLSGEGVHVPPERRRIGMLFQERTLFPHLSVERNVGYGLPRKGTLRKENSERISELLEFVELAGFEKRSPVTLSGGQQQRVAIARALAPRPRVLLMDEPFQGLDSQLRRDLCGEVRDMLERIEATAVIVTHDPDEAFLLGDEVAVMRDGRILQQDEPDEVFIHPISPWVGSFLGGANFVSGTADRFRALTPLGSVPITASARGDVSVLLRPSHITLSEQSAAAGVQGRVTSRSFFAFGSEYQIRVGDVDIVARSSRVPRFHVGDDVKVAYSGPAAAAYAQGVAAAEVPT